MNIKYTDGRGFPRIATEISDLYISIEEEKRDGSVSGYNICYNSAGISISKRILFFKDRLMAEKFIDKVWESVNNKGKKNIWVKANHEMLGRIIDLDKIIEEVNNEY